MLAPDEVTLFVARLTATESPCMVNGATAAILYGQPCVANDLNGVLSLDDAGRTALLRAFPASEFYVPPESVIRAASRPARSAAISISSITPPATKPTSTSPGRIPCTRGHGRNVAAYPGPMASPSTWRRPNTSSCVNSNSIGKAARQSTPPIFAQSAKSRESTRPPLPRGSIASGWPPAGGK